MSEQAQSPLPDEIQLRQARQDVNSELLQKGSAIGRKVLWWLLWIIYTFGGGFGLAVLSLFGKGMLVDREVLPFATQGGFPFNAYTSAVYHGTNSVAIYDYRYGIVVLNYLVLTVLAFFVPLLICRWRKIPVSRARWIVLLLAWAAMLGVALFMVTDLKGGPVYDAPPFGAVQ